MYQQYREMLHQLEAVNFTREQGEVLMQVIEERQRVALVDLATKRDLADLSKDLKHEIEMVQTNLDHKIDTVKKDMRYSLILVGVIAALSPHIPSVINYFRTLS